MCKLDIFSALLIYDSINFSAKHIKSESFTNDVTLKLQFHAKHKFEFVVVESVQVLNFRLLKALLKKLVKQLNTN